jgi:hypothetical protein
MDFAVDSKRPPRAGRATHHSGLRASRQKYLGAERDGEFSTEPF